MRSDSKQADSAMSTEAKSATKSATKSGYRFRVHDDAIALCRLVKTLAGSIERYDRKMAAQLRTATSSIVLNTAEGAGRRGGHQRERLSTAVARAAR